MLSKDGNCFKTADDIRKKEYLESLGYRVVSDDGVVVVPQDVELDNEPEDSKAVAPQDNEPDKKAKKGKTKKTETGKKAVELD